MDALFSYKNRLLTEPVRIDIERAKILTEAYRQNEGYPNIIRRAIFLDRMFKEKEIYIDENPIVGSIAKRPNAVYTSPEFSCRWLRRELGKGAFHDVGLGVPTIDSEDDREILLDTVSYWEDKCAFVRGSQIYNDEYRDEATVGELQRYGMWNELIWSFPQGSISPDYSKVLNVGLDGIMTEVEDRLNHLPIEMTYMPMKYFYEAALITLKALVAYSERFASLADRMAENETGTERKKQLRRIAACCKRVPAKPARNFREACQTMWFIWMACQIETPTSAIVLGRPGNYLYPFYTQDIAEGTLTDEEAIKLLGWTFLKCQGHGMFFSILVMVIGETFACLASSALLINIDSLISFNLFLLINVASRMLSTKN